MTTFPTAAPSQRSAVPAWLAFYERFWTRRLDALEDLLQAGKKKGNKR